MSPTVGYATLQVIPSVRGVHTTIRQELNGRDIGQEVGADISEGVEQGFDPGGLESRLSAPMAAAGLAVGAVIGAAALEGIQQAIGAQAGQGLVRAQLGLSEAEAAAYGDTAGKVYAANFGDSLAGAQEAVAAVGSSLSDSLGPGEDALQRVTEQALTFAQVFGGDVAEATTVAGTAIRTGLAEDATEAFDLMTAASQKMPAGIRSELLPAVEEYGVYLAELGFTGEEAFGLLAKASEGGAVQLDKAGDALKEFQILATDGSESTGTAFESIGLDAHEMAADILAGGDTAKGALDQVISGLLAVPDPTEQAAAALALFGTPLEDISVSQIPQFLEGLQSSGDVLGDFAGATDEAAAAVGEGLGAKLETLKREALGGLVDFTESYVLPALEAIADHSDVLLVAAGGFAALAAAQAATYGVAAIGGLFAVGGALEVVAIRAAYAAQGVGQIVAGLVALPAAANLGTLQAGVANLRTSVAGLASTSLIAGGLVAGIGAGAVAIWSVWRNEAKKAEESTEAFFASLEYNADTFDLHQISDALAAANERVAGLNSELQEYDGIIGGLRALGEIIDPTLPNDFARLAKELGTTSEEAEKMHARFVVLNDAAVMAGLTWEEFVPWAERLNFDTASQSAVDMAIAIHDARQMAETGSPVVENLAVSFATVGDETASATDKLDAFKDAIDAIVGTKISAEQALLNFTSGLQDLYFAARDAAEAGEVWSTTLTGMTPASLETREMVSGLAQDAIDLAVAYGEAGGGIEGATYVLEGNRQKLIETGISAGISREEMEAYLETLGLTPENITSVIAAQTDEESVSAANRAIDFAAADETANIYADVDEDSIAVANRMIAQAAFDRRVQIFLEMDPASRAMAERYLRQGEWQFQQEQIWNDAMGERWGGITHYAMGGIHAHVARGDVIRYAEPATGGEAFIPRLGDRDRSMSVLRHAAGWLDASVIDKKRIAGSRTMGEPATVVEGGVNFYGVPMSTMSVLSAEAGYEMRRLGLVT